MNAYYIKYFSMSFNALITNERNENWRLQCDVYVKLIFQNKQLNNKHYVSNEVFYILFYV